MPAPKFRAGDRVRSVHNDNRTGTVVDWNSPIQSQKPIEVFAAVNYEVQWDDRSAPELGVREDLLKPALEGEEHHRVGSEEFGSRLLRAVEAIAIRDEDALAIAKQYLDQSKVRFPTDEDSRHQLRAADKIIGRYSRLAAMVGTASGLPGIVPGLGTAIAVVGGATADSLICMKLQVDMCMCLAAAFKYDISSEDGKHLAFLIAATGAAQRAGVETGARVGSQAGVRMLRQYLRGAALQAVKQAFRRAGITFTQRAVVRAIPFGVGAGIGGAANYWLTRYVGRQAKDWFIIDQDYSGPDDENSARPMPSGSPDSSGSQPPGGAAGVGLIVG